MYLPGMYVAEIVRLGNGPWLPYSAKLNLHIPFSSISGSNCRQQVVLCANARGR